MNDVELKAILRSLRECVTALTQQQGVIVELLGTQLSGAGPDTKEKLRRAAEDNLRNVEKLKAALL